ncbi:S8 family peptidase [Streptomyces uncialis]|uniref:S8 family peptidase n=1 Tax=Streptomyces uncialis TaxID=1048205 RepID=UPI00224CB90E|nr:S8 family serine peptidase [Streptomyces uncialis]MCX4660555.1 S8 family serine peptidase [Streptomyces uncialis]
MTTLATAVAVVLTAGLTTPASAGPGDTDRSASPRPAPDPAHSRAAGSAPDQRVTLITGDRVFVDGEGRVVRFEAAEGREGIPVRRRTMAGRTHVIPLDAVRLVESGRLDRRLFDITELTRVATRRAQGQGLKVIVGYRGAAAQARAEVRSAGDTRLRRSLKTLNAEALTTPEQDTARLWEAVTSGRDGSRDTASGVSRIWLDGVREAVLDKSVPQIGAPKAWTAGWTGKGVRIAVLDTGVDTTHDDLRTQVVAEKNFTPSPDTKDRYGHGTHVASIAAGTGAKSGGKHKGVAPDAKLLNGKVLGDNGFGDDSGVVAGMEWAAEQGADIVNLSLGGPDSPGVDPMEAQINKLSAEKGILFAVAAGNAGPRNIDSPGSADHALTVGAVDGGDALADFSGTGPRTGDGAVKPDLTAPGVGITAAAADDSLLDGSVGQDPAGYLTIDGTSMATPHVAGAAALLKQKHPGWSYAELKAALTSSAKGGAYSPFEQGSGRVRADKALDQTVVADPVSLGFGTARWPHTDDTPLTRQLTYRNLGGQDVTLDLALTARDPAGRPAPAGFFTLAQPQVTVPAGGTASVALTAATRLGGTADGMYSAYVVATGGGQSVRTGAAVEREVESYDLTVRTIGRDGRPAKTYESDLTGISGAANGLSYDVSDPSGTATVRVPKSGYVLNSTVSADPVDHSKGTDWIVQPKLRVDRDTTVTVDARKAKPVTLTVPDRAARAELFLGSFTVANAEMDLTIGTGFRSLRNVRTAHLGPKVTDGSLSQQWDGHWSKGNSQYSTLLLGSPQQFSTGLTKHYKAGELSTVKVAVGASARGVTAGPVVRGFAAGTQWSMSEVVIPKPVPGTRTLHLSTSNQVRWTVDVQQFGGAGPGGIPVLDTVTLLGEPQLFKAGRTYTKTFNVGVFGPRVGGEYGVGRDGDTLFGYIPLFTDGQGHAGFPASDRTSARTTLYREGRKLAGNRDPLTGEEFTLPAGDAAYRLTSSVTREAGVARISSRIDTSFTFRSRRTARLTHLPVSTARFGAVVRPDGTVPAGRTQVVPVKVQGAAAGRELKSLLVYVSYDQGRVWKKLTVSGGKVSVKNPAAGKGISLRAKITDRAGNGSTVSIHNAYYGK